MTAVLESEGLGKRYRKRWALSGCTLRIPAGHVAGLVGPNGAGKTTLLHLATGLLAPTSGTITVIGGRPAGSRGQLAKVGFVAQDTPVYGGLSVADHLKLGAHLNPGWDADLARRRIEQLGLDPAQRAGKLSGGQRAQLALTMAIAKRPRLLILDEPVASLDPLARREFLQVLMEAVAEQEISVLLSSHLIADLERVCDYLIVLVGSHVQVAGEVDDLLAGHHLLTGPRRDPVTLPAGQQVIHASHRLAATRDGSNSISQLKPALFGAGGIAPLGYAAFAFMLGVTAGVLIRGTLPAMAVTFALFAAVQLAWPLWVRPHLIPPVRIDAALNPAHIDGITSGQNGFMQLSAGVDLPNAWIVSNRVVTAAGKPFSYAPKAVVDACFSPSFRACQAALGKLHLRQLVSYQPASRHWEFQWLETAIFLGLAVALAGLCAWWLRRRLA